MILPARCRIITRPTACEKRKTPVRLSDHRVPFVSGEVHERRADAVPGVVDEEVDAPEGLERPRDHVVHVARVGHVARKGQGAAPLGAHRVGDRIESRLAATAHHHVRSDPGQLDGDRAPDPLARSRDDRHAASRVSAENPIARSLPGAGAWPERPAPTDYTASGV